MAATSVACALGCSAAPDERADADDAARNARPFASDQATLLSFEWSGELVTPWTTNPAKYIEDQLLYTVGLLNAYHSVARLDRLALSKVKTSTNGDGWMRVQYQAVLPVGWGSKDDLPATFDLVLPRRVTTSGLQTFAATYSATCVGAGEHTVTPGNFWYHYRPEAAGCALSDAHVVRTTATVTLGEGNTSGKMPELHHVWADNTLRVVSVFGKYEDGATDPGDAGIQAYDAFLERLPQDLDLELTTTPASVPHHPGTSVPDVTFEGRTADGRALRITALLIDSPKVAGAAFDARYAELTRDADLIVYDGHAGLGANVRALAEKGSFQPGRWQLFFLNGCDTFAYLDDRLAERRALLNPDDPTGTKYMDVVTNLMPAYFVSMPTASIALMRGLLEAPRTYEEIFAGIDHDQVVVVTGEEDNVFDAASPPPWPGIRGAGALARGASERFETPELAPGKYLVETRAKVGKPGGDADLYVGLGFAPSTGTFSFAPYLWGSSETVLVELEAPTRLHLLVHGYEGSTAALSHYEMEASVAP